MPRRARENTLSSFALALDAGADGIELDVHATADGVVIVHHDPVLPGGLSIASSTLQELRAHAAHGNWELATLRDTCGLIAGAVALYVELKGTNIEHAVVGALSEYEGLVAIHSFDHAMIGRLHASGCRYSLGILLDETASSWRGSLRATGANTLWVERSLATAALVRDIHNDGAEVIVWTVNDRQEAERLADMGVDGICTDDVGIVQLA